MKTEKELKDIVRDSYTKVAEQSKDYNLSTCCGTSAQTDENYSIMAESYEKLDGYHEDADLGLGCGLPTNFAKINEGDTVIDLGSGAGNDAFVARHETGATGKVLGIDFTPAMITKARINADKRGFNNVEFREGDIDNMPVAENTADVVVSNCVLNLVPNKQKVMNDMFRVIKPGGHFSVSDIVLRGELPEGLINDSELYAGCVSGAIQLDEYIDAIEKAGFENVEIQKEKIIQLPDDMLLKYLNASQIEELKQRKTGIFSITVYGEKPGASEKKNLNLKELQTAGSETDCGCGPAGCC
jgi:SAM-dependent methyltransferase